MKRHTYHLIFPEKKKKKKSSLNEIKNLSYKRRLEAGLIYLIMI